MKFKGNKGEWKISHYDSNGYKSTEIHYGNDGECVAEHVANEHDAKLIAAAPELLEALQNVYNDLESWKYIHNDARELILNAINKALK